MCRAELAFASFLPLALCRALPATAQVPVHRRGRSVQTDSWAMKQMAIVMAYTVMAYTVMAMRQMALPNTDTSCHQDAGHNK